MMKRFLPFLVVAVSLFTPPAEAGPSDGVTKTDLAALGILGEGGTNAGGTTIQTDEFSGAATYSVPIPVPPARGGLSPNLVLNYNSYRRNANSWVGYGWELDVGSIQRTPSADGTIDYLNGKAFEARFAGQSESLQLVTEGVDAASYNISLASSEVADLYQANIESSFNLYFHIYVKGAISSGDRWVTIDKGGLRYSFGEGSESREGLLDAGIARWLLSSIEDTNKNTMLIRYNPSSKLLDSINYQDTRIEFDVDSLGGDLTYFPIFKEGFVPKGKAWNVLRTIRVFQVGIGRLQVIKFDYANSASRRVRQLTSLQQFGRTDFESLPPVEFEYDDEKGFSFSETSYDRTANHVGLATSGVVNQTTTFADMNGDGLVDKVTLNPDASFEVYFNTGNDFRTIPGRSRWEDPFPSGSIGYGLDPSTPWQGKLNAFWDGHQWLFLIDMNGDHLPDRVSRAVIKDAGKPTETAVFRIAFNNGHGWEKWTTDWPDPYVGPWAGTTDENKGLIDMNGDGLPDRVIGDRINDSYLLDSLKAKDKGNFLVFYNNGSGFSTTPVLWKDPLTQFAPDHSERARLFAVKDKKEKDVKTFLTIRDMNGDGLPDRVIRSNLYSGGSSLGIGFSTFLNKGNGWAQPEPTTIDGKKGFYSNGFDTVSFVDPVIGKDEDKGYLDKKHDLIDVNGDGFLDRVAGDSAACKIRFYVYQGMKEGEDFAQLSSAIELNDPFKDSSSGDFQACGYLSNSIESVGYYEKTSSFPKLYKILYKGEGPHQFVFFQDFNGDGLPDRLALHTRGLYLPLSNSYDFYPLRVNTLQYSDSPGWWKNKEISQPIGALREVRDGKGGRTAIEYQPSTWPDTPWPGTPSDGKDIPHHNRFLPFNMNLVHKVYTEDHTLSSSWTPKAEEKRYPGMRRTDYRFRGGNYFVQYATDTKPYFARFNGFQEVRKTVSSGAFEAWATHTTVTRYHQALGDIDPLPADLTKGFDAAGYTHFALSGKSYRQEVVEVGETHVSQEMSWGINAKGTSNLECDASTWTKVKLCYPRQFEADVRVYEEGSPKPRESTILYDYDDLGNITKEHHAFRAGDDKLYSFLIKETVYKEPGAFAKGLAIRNRPASQVKKGPGGKTIYRKKEFEYDERGNPTGEIFFVDGTKTQKIKRTFNGNGTLATITDTDGVTKEIGYDPAGLFPISETVKTPSGTPLTTTRAFNRLNGEVLLEIGPQGVGKRITWDSFGRKTKEMIRSAGGLETKVREYSYNYLTATVKGWKGIVLQQTQVWEIKPDHPDTDKKPAEIVWTDGSGQVLQGCRLSERGNYRLQQFRVDNGGRREFQTEPVFSDTCNFLSDLAPGVRTYEKRKDLAGREIYLEPPPGDPSSPVGNVLVSYRTNGERGLEKTTINPKGEKTIETYDTFERLLRVTDPAGSVTTYSYNPVGDLLEVTGAGKVLTTIEYDLLGRKAKMTDADMGTWKYDYDDYGRLKTQTDNKKQSVTFKYDSLGRIKEKKILRADGGLEKVEISTYDSGAGGYDVKPGELFQVEEFKEGGKLVRSTRFAYDPLYRRTAKLSRSIDGVGTFDQTLEHDVLGRVTETKYPGAHKLLYSYMINGNLKEVCGDSCDKTGTTGEVYYSLEPSASYDVFGALQKETYGNGVTGEYGYYPGSHRLKDKKIAKGSEVYDKKDFQYDKMSNIVNLDGSSDWGSLSGITYDTRDRLTSYTPKKGSGVQTLTYDLRGNILKNAASYGDKAYEYTSPRPHAVTKIGDDLFDYDENGNMTKDPSRKMTYNTSNQLARVDMSSGDVVTYDYDYTGARVSKQVDHKDVYHKMTRSMTHYLGDAIELKGDQIILNIFAGSRKVATRTLGLISKLGGTGGGSLVNTGIDPEINSALLMPFLMMMFVLFVLASLRPVDLSPALSFARRGGRHLFPLLTKEGVRGRSIGSPLQWLRTIYLLWRSYCLTLQETLAFFPYRAALKAFMVFMAILFIVEMPALSYAGDTGEPKFPVSDTDFFYYHHDDHLGSSHILTEGKVTARHSGLVYKQGEILQRFEYAPFGKEVFVLNPNLKFDPSYTGQTYDIESGLYYYKSRYYNPVLARFTQPDTVVPDARNLQAYNRYSYVSNNPLKYIDPSGHFWGLFIAAILIAAAIGATASAISGGNVWMGALQGAIVGAAFFGAGQVIVAAGGGAAAIAAGNGISLLAQTLIHAAAGAIAGAINTAIAGGNLAQIGQGSLIGGISGGAGKFAGHFLDKEGFLTQLFGRSIVGAATGAAAAAITGGDPWKGAGFGAAYAAAGTIFNDVMHKGGEFLKNRREEQSLRQLEVDQRFKVDRTLSEYYENLRGTLRKDLGVVSTGALILAAPLSSPILGVAGAFGLGAVIVDALLEFSSRLKQGDFSGANRVIRDDLLTAPGTGLNPN